MHVTFDGRVDNVGENWSIRGVYDFCRDAVRLADMTLVSGPHVTAHKGQLYGMAVLAESHVSVHLDKRTKLAFIEMFSCKDFDSVAFCSLASDRFDIHDAVPHVLDRELGPL